VIKVRIREPTISTFVSSADCAIAVKLNPPPKQTSNEAMQTCLNLNIEIP